MHLRVVCHDVPRAVSKPVSKPALAPACNRVLRTSKENIAIRPMRPAAPARTGDAKQCSYYFRVVQNQVIRVENASDKGGMMETNYSDDSVAVSQGLSALPDK
jgi:hypothetical protein